MFKAGKIAIIGRPNVGKSTLLNVLIKEELSVVSYKPETTRDNIQGVISGKDFQAVFIDTPGMHKPKTLLGKTMVRRASSILLECDISLVLIDAHAGVTAEDIRIFQNLDPEKLHMLIVNKIDLVDKRMLLPLIEKASRFPFKEIIPVPAVKKNGTETVFKKIIENLPEGFPLFPEDQLSDKNERFFIQEFIRGCILELTHQEVPHAIAVVIENMEEKKDASGRDICHIEARIYVERPSQKSIIIGKSGGMLKKIGVRSREKIENFLKKKVFLGLWVKVQENWRKDESALRRFGY